MDKTWTVLKFNAEDTVEAVPTTWIFGNRCYWPPLTKQKMLIAIKNHESPSTCWPSFAISFFKNGTFDTYLEARQKCRRAECQSDLLSEEDDLKNRKFRNKRVIYPSSSSSEEEGVLPDPPTKNKSLTSRNTDQKKDEEQRGPSGSSCDGNIDKKKDEEQPGPSGSFCDDSVLLRKLAADFEAFTVQSLRKQNMLTSILTDVLSEVKSLKNTIAEINVLKISDSAMMRRESIFEALGLPARTIQEFKEIEKYLQPQENFTNVIQEISKIGGNSAFEFVKRVTLQFMTYKTATCFTWYGRKEKLCFKDTKMAKVILESSGAIGSRKQIEEALQKFFRRAKERSHKEKEDTVMPETND